MISQMQSYAIYAFLYQGFELSVFAILIWLIRMKLPDDSFLQTTDQQFYFRALIGNSLINVKFGTGFSAIKKYTLIYG